MIKVHFLTIIYIRKRNDGELTDLRFKFKKVLFFHNDNIFTKKSSYKINNTHINDIVCA